MIRTTASQPMSPSAGMELPEGWTMGQLGELADVLDSMRVPVNSDERQGRAGRIPYYGATGQVGWIDDFLFDEELLLLGEDGAPFLEKSKPIAYIIQGKSWVNNHAHVLRANAGTTSNAFLKYFLDSFDFSECVNGSTRLKLTQNAMRSIQVLLPPLAEQKRIVSKVEDLLARVNEARARLAKAPAILKRLRQSILAAACSGQLTGTGNGGALPPGWSMARLDSLFAVRTGGTPDRKRPEYYDGKIPWVRTTEVQNCDIYATGETITQEGLDNSSAKVFPPSTLLIALYGEGKTRGQVARLKVAAATNQACSALINPKLSPATNSYVFWCLRRDYSALREQSAGGNQPNLSNGLIKAWEIPLPPLDEQREIVRRVEALFALGDQIEARIQAATVRADKLTRAVLAKAFRGELVTTEAELAQAEGREYEPGSVLLDRIRASRQQEAGKPNRCGRQVSARQPEEDATDDDSPASAEEDEINRPVPIRQTDRNDVMATIRDIFSTGGTRTRDEAIHEIASALGYRRVGTLIDDILDDDIRTAVRRGILENTPDGLRLLCRDISLYTRDFLIKQMIADMGSGWWDREDLMAETARWLGFRRTGPVIRERLKSAINGAIRRGILEANGQNLRKMT